MFIIIVEPTQSSDPDNSIPVFIKCCNISVQKCLGSGRISFHVIPVEFYQTASLGAQPDKPVPVLNNRAGYQHGTGIDDPVKLHVLQGKGLVSRADKNKQAKYKNNNLFD